LATVTNSLPWKPSSIRGSPLDGPASSSSMPIRPLRSDILLFETGGD
jgi:hypothetical protein